MKHEYDFSKGKRGAVLKEPVKVKITIRLDGRILDWFRAQCRGNGDGNYQTMINDALNAHIDSREESDEKKIRRLLREELASYSVKKKPRSKAST